MLRGFSVAAFVFMAQLHYSDRVQDGVRACVCVCVVVCKRDSERGRGHVFVARLNLCACASSRGKCALVCVLSACECVCVLDLQRERTLARRLIYSRGSNPRYKAPLRVIASPPSQLHAWRLLFVPNAGRDNTEEEIRVSACARVSPHPHELGFSFQDNTVSSTLSH